MPRQYTKIIVHEEAILKMREEGKSKREIANALGLRQEQIKEFLKQYNRRQRADITEQRKKGRPRKRPITASEEMALRIKELEREVALLRSFLHIAGRM